MQGYLTDKDRWSRGNMQKMQLASAPRYCTAQRVRVRVHVRVHVRERVHVHVRGRAQHAALDARV